MEQIIEKNVRFCGCCHRELPVDSFYVDKRTLAPDNYCKECRRAMSNARYRRSLPASNPLVIRSSLKFRTVLFVCILF